jgi:hypothetical protein
MKKLSAIFFLSLLVSAEATACSCALKTLDEFVDNADSIYLATLQEAKFIPGEYGREWPSIKGAFLVRKVLKGPPQAERVTLTTGTGGGDCGVPMSVSQTYIIFKKANETAIADCDGSSSIDGFERDEVSEKILSIMKKHAGKRPKE